MSTADTYHGATVTYKAARKEATALRDTMRPLCSAISGPFDVAIINAGVEFEPKWFGGQPAQTIDASQLPSYEMMARTLAAYHKAAVALRSAWEQVPEDRRGSMVAPEDIR